MAHSFLPAPLTTKLLFAEQASILRNKKIAQVFYSMGLVERWGTGTTRIAVSLQEAQRPAPEFFLENGQFQLIFSKDLIVLESFQKMGLSKRQLQAIAYVEIHGSISNSDYQTLTGSSERTASINKLAIKPPIGANPNTKQAKFAKMSVKPRIIQAI